ncbi:Uu.00g017760.m01.CDS01 [Anthostomella pinea]|uniref:Uu.00g017760.m01.CDS01 n=1 Tax=Anthostomella pinea TaxID=933095 RepID=A0AAI8VYZ6_9PEZI|nr:Uu.00g017760.m01.CDS01 [Anthostomella pinea]
MRMLVVAESVPFPPDEALISPSMGDIRECARPSTRAYSFGDDERLPTAAARFTTEGLGCYPRRPISEAHETHVSAACGKPSASVRQPISAAHVCIQTIYASHPDVRPKYPEAQRTLSCFEPNDTQEPFVVIRDEPTPGPQPMVAPMRLTMGAAPEWERAPRKRRGSGSGWSGFSARRRLLPSKPSSSPRRPQISAPSNFRHLYSDSFRFPDDGLSQLRPRPRSFHPLELSIYIPDEQLSPILPHFDYPSPPVTPPQRAYTISSRSDNSRSMSHERSYSSMSFHIPRRPVNGGSVFDSPRSDTSTLRRPQPARVRAYTSPSPPPPLVEDLVEKVANALLERDRLQEQIDDVVERQSIYISSRPSTAHGASEMEPMPVIPALPPDAPSFSERLSSDRPRTAPSKAPVRVPYRANSSRRVEGHIPPPPLPLRLRPPLRKKKSFSRVSTWLFPSGEHHREISLDSLTNAPKPVTDAEGYYQIANPALNRRRSFDSDSTVSDWSVEEQQTLPTSLSPSSTATPKAMAEPALGVAFGLREPVILPQRNSVGVAF